MVKFLPIIAVVGILIGVLIYFKVHSNADLKSNQDLVSQMASSNDQSASQVNSTTSDDRLKTLELAVGALIQKVNRIDNSLSATNSQLQSYSDLESRVKKLETQVADLESRTGTTQQTLAQPATPAIPQKYPLYIQLATTGNSGDRNVVPLPGSAVTIDPASYPGYTSAQLEVNMNLNQSVGGANAFLYDSAGKTAVSGSEVSTSNDQPTYLLSAPFKLPSSAKIYSLAIQSTQGYNVNVYSAQLKINFQ